MNVSPADLLALMKDAGLDEAFVDGLKPNVALKDQGFKSVYLPALLLAVEERWGREIPATETPGAMTLEGLAAYLERILS